MAIASSALHAQAPAWPNAADIDRAMRDRPFPNSDRLSTQPIPRPPQINATPSGVDITQLLRDHTLPQNPTAATPPLRIFITLDMPRASLQRLTEQAARSGAVLVLRGLKSQSMRETLAAFQTLVADHAAAWQIDPQAFTRYDIHHAPTFVLPLAQTSPNASAACGTTCPVGEAHIRVSGDVSLAYALETMVRRHPEAASRADVFLKRLRASR